MSTARRTLFVLVAWCLCAFGCGPQDAKPGLDLSVPQTQTDLPVIVPDTSGGAFTVTVQGKITFQKLHLLDDAGNVISRTATIEPLRLVDVEAHDASGALVSTQVGTDDTGVFSLAVQARTAYTLVVKSSTTANGGRFNVEVRDPTSPFPLYAIVIGQDAAGTPFPAANAGAVVTLTIDPLPSLTVPAGSTFRPGAVANILDAAFNASEAQRLATGLTLPKLTYFWSPASKVGSFFNEPASIFVLGGNSDTDDTDEFDDSVIEHEFGHFLVFSISRDVSLGGSHAFDDVLYPTLAYSEGMADWWSCAARKVPVEIDSQGITGNAVQFFSVQFESTGTQAFARGRESEATVAELLWDLADGTEGRPSTDADPVALTLLQMITALKNLRNTVSYLVIDDFLQALIDSGAVARTTIDALILQPEDQKFTFAGADAFPTPIVRGGPFLQDTVRTVLPAPLGSHTGIDRANRFFKFDLPSVTNNVSLSVQLSNVAGTDATGTNVDLILLDANNTALAQSAGQTNFESILVPSLPAGRYYINVSGRPNPFANNDQQTNTSEQTVSFTIGLQ